MGIFTLVNILVVLCLGACKTRESQNYQNFDEISSQQQGSPTNAVAITKKLVPYDPSLPIVFIPESLRGEKNGTFSLSEQGVAGRFVREIIEKVLAEMPPEAFRVRSSLKPEIKAAGAAAASRGTPSSPVQVLPREGEISPAAAQKLVGEEQVLLIERGEVHESVQVLFTPRVNEPKICMVTEATGTSNFKEFSEADRDKFREILAKSSAKKAEFADEIKKIKEADDSATSEKEQINRSHPLLTDEQKSRIEVLNKELSEGYKKLAFIEEVNRVDQLVNRADTKPVGYTIVQGRTFYVSQIIPDKRGGRDLVVMYTANGDGDLVARLLYRSKSGGDWRVTPQKHSVAYGGAYSKGGDVHYTQETKLSLEILTMLDQLEKSPLTSRDAAPVEPVASMEPLEPVDALFRFDYLIDPGITDLFTREVHPLAFKNKEVAEVMKEIQRYKPSSSFVSYTSYIKRRDRDKNPITAEEYHRNIVALPEEINKSLRKDALLGFVPDFSKDPLKTYYFEHDLLGDITVEVYHGVLDGKQVDWHMASDPAGRIWIDRIAPTDGAIGSYGVLKEFIDSGALTNKPLEYAKQAEGLRGVIYPDNSPAIYVEKEEEVSLSDSFSRGSSSEASLYYRGSDYYDITGFIDQLQPIKEYRKARGIIRQKASDAGAQHEG